MALVPFDDRDGWIWLDGQLVPWRDAKLHVLTHGLHYASAVFEGQRAYNGTIFRLREHSKRLKHSGRILGFDIPYTEDELDAACIETLAANGLRDAYMRPIAWRGSEMLAVSAQHTKIHVAIAAWVWPAYFADRMAGIRLAWAEWRRPDPRTSPTNAKAAGGYMIGTLSKHKAESEGFQDAMMLDYRGQLSEATGANAFFIIDGKIHTPTPDCFLNGITRQTVIGIARRRQIPVIERAMFPEELKDVTEVFVTGSAAEVTPVRQIGEHIFTPGQITETLASDYSNLVLHAPAEVEAHLAA
jgi:branched-chain amino acid aminotransferase